MESNVKRMRKEEDKIVGNRIQVLIDLYLIL